MLKEATPPKLDCHSLFWGQDLFLLILGRGMAMQRIKIKSCYNKVNNYSYDAYSPRCTSVLSSATDLYHIQFIRV